MSGRASDKREKLERLKKKRTSLEKELKEVNDKIQKLEETKLKSDANDENVYKDMPALERPESRERSGHGNGHSNGHAERKRSRDSRERKSNRGPPAAAAAAAAAPAAPLPGHVMSSSELSSLVKDVPRKYLARWLWEQLKPMTTLEVENRKKIEQLHPDIVRYVLAQPAEQQRETIKEFKKNRSTRSKKRGKPTENTKPTKVKIGDTGNFTTGHHGGSSSGKPFTVSKILQKGKVLELKGKDLSRLKWRPSKNRFDVQERQFNTDKWHFWASTTSSSAYSDVEWGPPRAPSVVAYD